MKIESIEELDRVRDECMQMILRKAKLSAAAAAVPVPWLDLGSDIAILTQLLPDVNERFGLTQKQIDALNPEVKMLVLSAISAMGSKVLGKAVTKEVLARIVKKMGKRIAAKSSAKFVPIVGSAIAAGVSYSMVRYLGQAHVNECYAVIKRVLDERARQTDAPMPALPAIEDHTSSST